MAITTISKDDLAAAARAHTPKVSVKIHKNRFRHNVVDDLPGAGNCGIELGVAGGTFSGRMLDSGKFSQFWGVDLYGDHHDVDEYRRALKHVGLDRNYRMLRMSFDEALELFEDASFDFIYIDGYAHTGEEGGKTLIDWYRKLKVGGVMAGDDYSEDWPLVKWGVHNFIKQIDVELQVTGKVEHQGLNRYPSWFFRKETAKHDHLKSDSRLRTLGKQAADAVKSRQQARNAPANAPVSLSQDQVIGICGQMMENFPETRKQVAALLKRHEIKK